MKLRMFYTFGKTPWTQDRASGRPLSTQNITRAHPTQSKFRTHDPTLLMAGLYFRWKASAAAVWNCHSCLRERLHCGSRGTLHSIIYGRNRRQDTLQVTDVKNRFSINLAFVGPARKELLFISMFYSSKQ
jgi:hypothetical protein